MVYAVGHKWTDKEVAYLRNSYQSKTQKELAEILGVTVESVNHKATKLGLKKTTKEKINIVCKQCSKKFEVLPCFTNRKYCRINAT